MPRPGITWIKNLNLGAAAEAQLSGVARRAAGARIIREKIESWAVPRWWRPDEKLAEAARSVRALLVRNRTDQDMLEIAMYQMQGKVGVLSKTKRAHELAELDRAQSFIRSALSGSPDMEEARRIAVVFRDDLKRGGGGVSWGDRSIAVETSSVSSLFAKLLGKKTAASEAQLGMSVVAHEYAERVSKKVGATWLVDGKRPGGGSLFGHRSRLPMYAEYKAAARVGRKVLAETIEIRMRATSAHLKRGVKAEGMTHERLRAGISAAEEIHTMSRRILRKADPKRLARLQREGLFDIPRHRRPGDILQRMGAQPSEIAVLKQRGNLQHIEDAVIRRTGRKRQHPAVQDYHLNRVVESRAKAKAVGPTSKRGSRQRKNLAQQLRNARHDHWRTTPRGRREDLVRMFDDQGLTLAPTTKFQPRTWTRPIPLLVRNPGMPVYGSGHGGLVRELGKRGRRSKVISQRSRSSLVGTPAPEISPPMHRNQGNRLSRGGGGMA